MDALANRTVTDRELRAQLGMSYQKSRTRIQVWAPDFSTLFLNLYPTATDPSCEKFPMKKEGGIFQITLEGDYRGYFYTFQIGDREVTDPYSVATSLNSKRSAILDLGETDPPGFRDSSFLSLPPSKAILYELHIGDFTFSSSSGCRHGGKFLGLTEEGTHFNQLATGLDHLKELGATHVHLMPINDFETVDEDVQRFGANDNYNWGYDPELYNVPEGSYSTKPYDPKNRIRELKQMIQALHRKGIGVIMDCVYNHTFKTKDSNFNLLVPSYYYRQQGEGFSNGSGVGNEIASERPMVRKFIMESLLFWQREYHIDGFRFDLMALTDRETIEMALRRLREKNPNTIFYGEPWAGAVSSLPKEQQVRWSSQGRLNFGLFNDHFRDALRGDNDGCIRGFIQGECGKKEDVAFGLVGSVSFGERASSIPNPVNSINYFNAHDNLILEDKLTRSVGDIEQKEDMTRLAFGLLLTAEGIPFFHAGNEFRRSKHMDPNSYHSPYYINAINWADKERELGLFRYVKDLISLRKEHPVLSLARGEEVRKRVQRVETGSPNLVAFLYREREGFLFIIHSNATGENMVEWVKVLQKLQVLHLRARRIFDQRGRREEAWEQISQAEQETLRVGGLSTVIYELEPRSPWR